MKTLIRKQKKYFILRKIEKDKEENKKIDEEKKEKSEDEKVEEEKEEYDDNNKNEKEDLEDDNYEDLSNDIYEFKKSLISEARRQHEIQQILNKFFIKIIFLYNNYIYKYS